jgi:3-oxoacyl-[acyl-carrier-protein] synthase III
MMFFINGAGHFHPPHVIDNAFLESMDIGTSQSWILERVGILARRTALPLEYIRSTKNANPFAAQEAAVMSAVDMAVEAARMALTRAGVAPEAIGMVVAGGSAPDFGAPATATLVAARLGISAPCFDINSACSTAACQLHWFGSLDARSAPEFALLLQPEALTKTVDYRDRRTAVLMGDCATALVVSRKHSGAATCRTTTIGSDPGGWKKVTIPARGFLAQDGSAVQAFAIRKTVEIALPFMQPGRVLIGHQANRLMLDAAAARLGRTAETHLFNVDDKGNCGAAGAPSVLSAHWEALTDARAVVVMAVVGAGLSWGVAEVAFGAQD